MATTTSGQRDGISNQPLQKFSGLTNVYIHIIFTRIGEIDTLNEKYQAHATLQARWSVELDKFLTELSSEDQKALTAGKSIPLPKYADTHWHPQLYIENAVGDLKELITYSANKSEKHNKVYICEHRDIKGVFWEKLELHHFPSDCQDLSISVASMLFDDKVVLHADPYIFSAVNRETFVDQQEWLLYKHVNSEERFVSEFLLRGDEEDEEQLGGGKNENRKRPILTVTCHAARQSNYFYWNGYLLIFFITIISFCVYAIPPNQGGSRVQTSCTLLLTSVSFRWTVNRSLPTLSYLSTLDKYSLMCICILVIQAAWHAIISIVIFLNTSFNDLNPTMWFVTLDQIVLFTAMSIFVIIHIALLIWLYKVPFGVQHQLAERDAQYMLRISEVAKGKTNLVFE